MSAFDVLHTPPPASLAAMLSLPDTNGQCLLWPSSVAPDMYSSTRSLVHDDLSSSDKENSPSHASTKQSKSKSASSTSMNTFEASHAKENMSFTPQRVRPPPRAWERRPATPFVLRSEGQKIWKRIPLQELGVEINQQVPKREKEGKESYLRAVKRLRLDVDQSFGIRSERNDVVPAVGTKWEVECIEKGGSPKKKRREREDRCAELEETSDQSDLAVLEQTALRDCSSERDLDDLGNSLQEGTLQPGQERVSSCEIVSTIHIAPNTVNLNDGPHSDALAGEAAVGNVADKENTQDNHNKSDVNATSTTTSVADGHGVAEHKTTLLTQDGEMLIAQPEPNSCLSVCPLTDGPTENANDGVNNLPPTKDQITTTTATTLCYSALLAIPINTAAPGINPPQALLPTDHEETAFLRDFLERAQASKAARIAASPQKKLAPVMDPIEEENQDGERQYALDNTETLDDIEDDDLSPPLETACIEQMFLSEDKKASSPTRRSARTAARAAKAANSRLPYFQFPPAPQFSPVLPSQHTTASLPNTIQLKRATGGEFVFNAKLQQTLAMMTRSNTKRNQGDAIRVTQRLAQIKKELEILQQEAPTSDSVAPQDAPSSVESVTTTAQDVKHTNKKRKRDKQDEGRVFNARRNVRWPDDEQLVKYREPSPSPSLPESNDTFEREAADPSAPDDAQPKNESETLGNSELATADKQSSKAKKVDTAEDSAKLKVRRIRKIKLDSVNGTPAPKTRSCSVSEVGPLELDRCVTVATGISIAASGTRKSSRMPLPISTPIPLPALNGARSKIHSVAKNKDTEKPRTTQTATAVSSSESRSEKQSNDRPREEPKSDDGRRRLRGRS